MLDLKKHRHESQDGRHVQQMCMLTKARWERESQFFVPKGTMPS